MARTIRIEDSIPQIEVKLSGEKTVKLCRPGFRAQHQAPWAAQRPGWGNAPAATDSILLRASREGLTKAELHGLGKSDRHRLMLGVVQVSGSAGSWRYLYGTSLTLDERFLATMNWVEQREAKELQAGLREMRQRLIEHPRAEMGMAPRLTPGIVGLGKQFEAMNSLSRMAKTTTLFSSLKSPVLAGLGPGLATSLSANIGMSPAIAGIAKASLPAFDLQPMASPALSKMLMSPTASAGLNAEMSRITSQIGALSIAKEMGTGAFLSDYMSGIPSIAKRLEFVSGSGSIAKQLENALGRSAFLGIKSTALFGEGLTGALSQFDPLKLGFGGNLWRQTQGVMESLMMAELARLWGEDPLWFLIAYLDPRKLPALLSTSREEVFEAVLDGLEGVVRDSTLIEQLITACEGLGFLAPEQRAWLNHGLEHAHRGEWDQAMPPLILGFEGAIFNGAVAAEVIAGREGKKLPAEKVIKAISLDEDLEKFAIRLVFGGPGNALRHGRPENVMRDQALPLIVALVGWLDFTLGTSGTARLANELEDELTSVLGTGGRRELLAPNARSAARR
jgi:hypothetical protein